MCNTASHVERLCLPTIYHYKICGYLLDLHCRGAYSETIIIDNVSHEKIDCAAAPENQQCAKAKTKAQISFAVTAGHISAFVFDTRIVQFIFFLNPKFLA